LYCSVLYHLNPLGALLQKPQSAKSSLLCCSVQYTIHLVPVPHRNEMIQGSGISHVYKSVDVHTLCVRLRTSTCGIPVQLPVVIIRSKCEKSMKIDVENFRKNSETCKSELSYQQNYEGALTFFLRKGNYMPVGTCALPQQYTVQ